MLNNDSVSSISKPDLYNPFLISPHTSCISATMIAYPNALEAISYPTFKNYHTWSDSINNSKSQPYTNPVKNESATVNLDQNYLPSQSENSHTFISNNTKNTNSQFNLITSSNSSSTCPTKETQHNSNFFMNGKSYLNEKSLNDKNQKEIIKSSCKLSPNRLKDRKRHFHESSSEEEEKPCSTTQDKLIKHQEINSSSDSSFSDDENDNNSQLNDNIKEEKHFKSSETLVSKSTNLVDDFDMFSADNNCAKSKTTDKNKLLTESRLTKGNMNPNILNRLNDLKQKINKNHIENIINKHPDKNKELSNDGCIRKNKFTEKNESLETNIDKNETSKFSSIHLCQDDKLSQAIIEAQTSNISSENQQKSNDRYEGHKSAYTSETINYQSNKDKLPKDPKRSSSISRESKQEKKSPSKERSSDHYKLSKSHKGHHSRSRSRSKKHHKHSSSRKNGERSHRRRSRHRSRGHHSRSRRSSSRDRRGHRPVLTSAPLKVPVPVVSISGNSSFSKPANSTAKAVIKDNNKDNTFLNNTALYKMNSLKEQLRAKLIEAQKYTSEDVFIDANLEGKNLITANERKSSLPLNNINALSMGGLSGQKVTPQQALIHSMAAMHAKAQEITGVAVPKYYNPTAVNPLKYAETLKKRKLLWSKNKEKETGDGNLTAQVGDEWGSVSSAADKNKEAELKAQVQWSSTSFASDQDGKMAAKFRKLMGIRDEDKMLLSENLDASKLTQEQRLRQEELFQQLDREYQFARITTHQNRGLGLGFQSQMFPDDAD